MADSHGVSEMNSSQMYPIGSAPDDTLAGYHNPVSRDSKPIHGYSGEPRVLSQQNCQTSEEKCKQELGSFDLDDDLTDTGVQFNRRRSGRDEHSKFLPRLVFLGSDENLADTGNAAEQSEFNHFNRHEQESERNGNALALANQANNANYRSVDDLSESNTEISYNLKGTSQNFIRNRISVNSIQSSDSDLLADHVIAMNDDPTVTIEDDFEQFIMDHLDEEDPVLKNWHCHSLITKVPPDKMARNQLIAVSVLCFLFMIGEAVGGAISNSLALFTDVLHLGCDLISFLISLMAIYLSKKPANKTMSFGYHRAEVLGALISVFIIWAVTGVLVYMAVERIVHEHYKDVKPDEMLVTAILGVVFNVTMGIVLHSELCCRHAPSFGHNHSHGSQSSHSHDNGHHSNYLPRSGSSHSDNRDDSLHPLLGREEDIQVAESPSTDSIPGAKPHPKNINVRAAFIHVVGDIIQSLGVFLSSLIIKLKPDPKYRLADPICTFTFSILVLFTTITVLRDTLRIIMEAVPKDTNYYAIKTSLQKIPGVKSVHGLTVWCLTLEKNALAVHIAVDVSANPKTVLCQATEMVRHDYNIVYTTIQVEDYRPEMMTKCSQCVELHK